MSKHSPLPWKEDSFYGVVDAKGNGVCWYTNDDDGIHFTEGDNMFIIEAVNNYEKLLALNQELVEALEELHGASHNDPNCQFCKALRRAKGETR